jgi:hypothetical protein
MFVKIVRSVIQSAVFFLGIFEFMHLFQTINASDESKLIAKLKDTTDIYPPSVIEDRAGRLFLCIFLFFLGLLRVTWAINPVKGLTAWFSVVLTHVGEAIFFWNLALLPHFNKAGLSLPDLFQQVIQNKLDCRPMSRVILLVVPVIALVCFLHGPDFPPAEKKTKRN